MAAKTNTFKEIWSTLSKVNVNEHTDDKGGLTYLSWAWAWGTLMEHYPQATYTFREWDRGDGVLCDFFSYPDGSVKVEVTISIDGHERSMWLPVMDYRNRAIEKPNSRQISDTKMRCLAKCMAMFGLGHYIFAGEDLPSEEKDSAGNKGYKSHKEKLNKAEEECKQLWENIKANWAHPSVSVKQKNFLFEEEVKTGNFVGCSQDQLKRVKEIHDKLIDSINKSKTDNTPSNVEDVVDGLFEKEGV
tara:strand:+ start:31005 stop:31739 length:735 start_codon:yes stop_codon:yes gene_type:complete